MQFSNSSFESLVKNLQKDKCNHLFKEFLELVKKKKIYP